MADDIIYDDSNVRGLIDKLNNWGKSDIKGPLKTAAYKIQEYLHDNIEEGKAPGLGDYPDILESTFEMQIARTGPFKDVRTRSSISTNPKAMNVTGLSMNSITVQSSSDLDVNIGYESARSDVVFRSNANQSGNIRKFKRDPLGLTIRIPTDKEEEIVGEIIEDAIDRLFDAV